MTRIRLLAICAAAAVALSAAAAAGANDGTLKAAIGKSLTPLFGQVAVLTKLQAVVSPGTSAAKQKAFAPSAIASGKTLAKLGALGLASLTAQKPSTAAGTKARAVCAKLFAGVKKGGTDLVAWGKAAAAGHVSAAATKSLAAFANSLVPAGLGCQTAYGGLK